MEHIILLKEDSFNLESWNNKFNNKKVFELESDPEQLKEQLSIKNIKRTFNDLKDHLDYYYNNSKNFNLIMELINNNYDQIIFEYTFKDYNKRPEHDPELIQFNLNIYLKNIMNLLFELIDLYSRPDILESDLNELKELLNIFIEFLELEQYKFKTSLNNNYINSNITGSLFNPFIYELLEQNLDMEEADLLEYLNLYDLNQININHDYDLYIEYPILVLEQLLIDSINDYNYPSTNIKYLNIDPEPYLIFSLMDIINLNDHILEPEQFKKHGYIIDPYKFMELLKIYTDLELNYLFDSYYEYVLKYTYNNKCYELNIYPAGLYNRNIIKLNSYYELLNFIESKYNNLVSNFKIDLVNNY